MAIGRDSKEAREGTVLTVKSCGFERVHVADS